jgi:glycosyltransferase involved in cell wall biosynthesis
MTVSVVIPFYNRPELLRPCLESVLKQTRPAHEILVADDCSKEDISWVATEFPTVKVLRLPENRGAAGARLHAMKFATGTHIATLDADDIWYAQKLEKQIPFAEKIGDPRGIYSHQQWVLEDGGGTVRPADGPYPGEPTTEYMYVRNGFIQSNAMLIEKSVYEELSLVSEGVYAHDFEIVMRADPLKCRIYVQKEVLSQWNCQTDPRRASVASENKYDRNYMLKQAHYFTPKARIAFSGRWVAPRLMRQGQYYDAGVLLTRALVKRALSPVSVAKIAVHGAFPTQFKTAAAWYAWLRGKKKKAVAAQP